MDDFDLDRELLRWTDWHCNEVARQFSEHMSLLTLMKKKRRDKKEFSLSSSLDDTHTRLEVVEPRTHDFH